MHYSISAGNMPRYIPMKFQLYSARNINMTYVLPWHDRRVLRLLRINDLRSVLISWVGNPSAQTDATKNGLPWHVSLMFCHYIISLGTRWCPICREVREHNWRFPKIGVTPHHTSHLTILLLNPWFWYIVVLTVCWLHPRICGIV